MRDTRSKKGSRQRRNKLEHEHAFSQSIDFEFAAYLIGQLLFQDWTVVKIMLTAIVVGMIGMSMLHHFVKVNLHIKPTRISAKTAKIEIGAHGKSLTHKKVHYED